MTAPSMQRCTCFPPPLFLNYALDSTESPHHLHSKFITKPDHHQFEDELTGCIGPLRFPTGQSIRDERRRGDRQNQLVVALERGRRRALLRGLELNPSRRWTGDLVWGGHDGFRR